MDIQGSWKADRPLFIQAAALFIFAAALPFSVTLIQGGILLFLAAGLYRTRADGAWQGIRSNPLFFPWLVYLAAGALAAALGVFPVKSFKALNSDLLTAVTFFALCLYLRPRQKNAALDIYLIAVMAAAAWGLGQALDGLARGLDVRAHAASHPVRFGEVLTIGLALALSRLSFPETLAPRVKRLLYAAVPALLAAIVLSQSRGAYLGTALLFLTLLFLRRPPLRVLMPLLAATAALGLVFSVLNPVIRHKTTAIFTDVKGAFSSAGPAKDVAINTRLELWKTGFRMINDRPLFGAGPASVKKLFPVYYPAPYPEGKIWGSLHNLYIHQAAERGLAGLGALLALFLAMLAVSLRAFRAAPQPATLWAALIMPSWFLMNVTEITFQHVHTCYAVLLALAVSLTAGRE